MIYRYFDVWIFPDVWKMLFPSLKREKNLKKASEYDKGISQPHTADQPTVTREKATEHIRKTVKVMQASLAN